MSNLNVANDFHGLPKVTTVTVTQSASILAVLVNITPLPRTLPFPSTLTLVSGSGPATIVTAGVVGQGAETLITVALTAGVTAGAVYSLP